MKISEDENFSENSSIIEVKPRQKYHASVNVIAKKCKPYTSFFVVFLLDSKKAEIERRYKWFIETGNGSKKYELIFSTTHRTRFVVTGYRINTETPFKGYNELYIDELSPVHIKQVSNYLEDDFDMPYINIPKHNPLTNDEENSLEKKMVWILGSIRSGTTWLSRDLLKHDSNTYWHEPCIGWHLDAIKEWRMGREDYFFSHFHKHNWLFALRKLILARTYSQIQSLTKNVIIKEPNGSGSAQIIMECFPNSKLIFLVRDGRDVLDSIIDAHQCDSWNADNPITVFEPISNPEMRYRIIEKYSMEWKRITESVWLAYQLHDVNQRLLVKYEDLRKNTFYELKKIYKFLEIDVTNLQLQRTIENSTFENIPVSEKGSGKFYRSASPGCWINNFNEEEKRIMLNIMSETLTKMNYNI